MFDGLDEVNEESHLRNQVIRLLTDFTNQYHKNTFIITCRVAATDFVFEKFPYVEIADFTSEQINTFVRKWFSPFPQKGERFIKEINHLQNEGLHELAKTPILLTLLCVNFDETLTFPARKNEIYQEAIEALLKKWDASRNIKRDDVYRGLSVLRKRQMLSRIAAEFFQEREIFFTTQEIVRRLQRYLETLPEMQDESIDGEIVLRAMEAQHGILVERAHDIHSFSHLSLQEYFTSQYIVENASEKILQQLMEYVLISSWREVFLMVAGALPNADMFFQAFFKKQKAIIGKMQTITRLREALLSVPGLTLSQRFAIIMLMQEYRNCFKKSQMNHISKTLKELQSTIEHKLEKNIGEQLADVRSILFKLSNKVTQLRPDREHKGISKVEIIFGRVEELFETDETVEICRERATQINNVLEKIELRLQQLEARRPIPNNNISIQIEKGTIKEGLLDIERNLEVVFQCLGEIHNQLGTDIAGRKWHDAFTALDRAEFLTYLSLNQLLLECVRVSAVSNRFSLLAKAFLPLA